MNTINRFEIYPELHRGQELSGHEKSLLTWFKQYLDLNLSQILECKTFLVETKEHVEKLHDLARDVFTDTVIENLHSSLEPNHERYKEWLSARGFEKPFFIDISFRPGVTDNSAHAAKEALELLPELKSKINSVASGVLYFIEGKNLTKEICEKLAYEKLANTLLHKVTVVEGSELSSNNRFQNISFPHVNIQAQEALYLDINVNDEQLLEMSEKNCWALSLDELHQVQEYFKVEKRKPTDVEIEIIAQSWSEHCKHKIFAAEIDYSEKNLPAGSKSLGTQKINGIFKSLIRGSTLRIKEERNLPWLVSIFHDNAGIVRFDKNVDVCIKVETHNSPSALDPYGGALTGILGVNRDILGVGIGAKPIANTNVFCLAENKTFKENKIDLPLLLKNPDRIKEGVHLGVQDGGNKSGIPTVNGAFVFDRDFVGKPLVFCGTVGVMPQEENNLKTADKGQRPGDYIVMAGGRIGKDGIHGATFSSMELVDGVPASVVQIGDPITQKRLGDFLLEARTKGLFNSVTDNGAGGLSSSIGEMAQLTNGARVDLEKALVKYPGLSPYELMVSESQERMTFSVTKERINDFLALASKRSVEASVVGEFTNSGKLEVFYNEKNVANLSLHFLHESLRPMKLQAHYDHLEVKSEHWIKQTTSKKELPTNLKTILTDLLKSPNIRGHEHLVRRYDHEVKGATLVKPFTGSKEKGYSAPSDAGVVWMKPHGGESDNALAIGCGICPKVSKYDAYTMAEFALDEAVRNVVSTGANPEEMVLVDNYCWPDPILSQKNPDGAFKLAQLVRASQALYELSVEYGMPFVSGKDSMKNDFYGKKADGEKVKISVPPTLLITAMGRVPTLKAITTSELKSEGAAVYLIGDTLTDHHSAFELAEQYSGYQVHFPLPKLNGKKQLELYKKLHVAMKNGLIESSHDVSDGGLLLALVETSMATKYGLNINLNLADEQALMKMLFNEGAGRIVITVAERNQKNVEALFADQCTHLGMTTNSDKLILKNADKVLLEISNSECLSCYKDQVRGL